MWVPVPLTRGLGGADDSEQVHADVVDAHRAIGRRTSNVRRVHAVVHRIADIAFGDRHLDVAEALGCGADLVESWLGGGGMAGSARRGFGGLSGQKRGKCVSYNIHEVALPFEQPPPGAPDTTGSLFCSKGS